MRTGMPNYRLRCGLCKAYRYPVTRLSMPWNLISMWSLYRGGLCTEVVINQRLHQVLTDLVFCFCFPFPLFPISHHSLINAIYWNF